jgi:hypothetical protein
MSVSGIGSPYVGASAGPLGGGAAGAAGSSAADSATSTDSGSAFQYLVNYLKESPAKRMEDAWLAKHHLTEQSLAALPRDQQDAIRKQMVEDIKREMQEKAGEPGANANVVV